MCTVRTLTAYFVNGRMAFIRRGNLTPRNLLYCYSAWVLAADRPANELSPYNSGGQNWAPNNTGGTDPQ